MFEVEHSPAKVRCAREANVIDLVDPRFVEDLATEHRVETEVILDDNIEEVLVEIVADDPRNSPIGLPTVIE